MKPSTVAFYRYAIGGKVLPRWCARALNSLTAADVQALQSELYALGLRAASVNRVVHGGLRALLRDARRDGLLNGDPYDLVAPVREDPTDSIDPYREDERDIILAGFRQLRPHYYALVCFHFWQGPRPSESFALRWGKVDLARGMARIDRSWSGGFESYTKTVKSRRDVRLHSIVVEALRTARPTEARDDALVFQTPNGGAMNIRNFYQREWRPMLRA